VGTPWPKPLFIMSLDFSWWTGQEDEQKQT
jgi:hypothetical protein